MVGTEKSYSALLPQRAVLHVTLQRCFGAATQALEGLLLHRGLENQRRDGSWYWMALWLVRGWLHPPPPELDMWKHRGGHSGAPELSFTTQVSTVWSCF